MVHRPQSTSRDKRSLRAGIGTLVVSLVFIGIGVAFVPSENIVGHWFAYLALLWGFGGLIYAARAFAAWLK